MSATVPECISNFNREFGCTIYCHAPEENFCICNGITQYSIQGKSFLFSQTIKKKLYPRVEKNERSHKKVF